MKKDTQPIEAKKMHHLLLQYKYRDAVKRLIRGITHEYNNIFTGLSGQTAISLQEGESGKVSPKRKQLIQELLQRGREQTEILFEFSREVTNTKSSHSPERIAGKAINLLNSVSRLHYFELQSDSGLPKIFSNHRDILLMLFYLGENAIEAMSDGGGIELELSHGPERDGVEYVRFSMIDDGCGISANMEKCACDPFATTKEGCAADGLGLYGVQTIVTDHGGQLEFQHKADGGTIVTVDLPANQNTDQRGDNDPSTQGTKQLPQHIEKQVFLIIDDEEAMRDLLLDRLQRRGHIAFCAKTCAEAIEEFGQLSDIISAVLLDIGLRDDTGYNCARKLRAINDKVRIVFMSGMDHDDLEKMAPHMSFLKKPFSIEQLEQKVIDVAT